MKKFLLSLAAVALVSGFASAKTVYWDNSETDWANVYAHSWNPATTWPGEKVTETVEIDGKTYYAATIEDAKTTVIFDNGTGAQTEDLAATADAVYGKVNLKGGSIDPIGSIKNGVFTPAGAVEITYATIYVPVSQYDYSVAYIYSWGPEVFGGWPGSAMTKTTVNGTEYWSIKVDDRKLATVTGWQLNGGSDENKTEDLPAVDFQNGYAYDLDGTSVEVGQGGGDDPDPDVVPLYIVGSVSNWTSSAAYKMTADGNGNYTIHLDKLSGDFKITTDIVAGKWNDEYTYTSGEAMALGQEYTCTAGGSANMSVEGLGATDVTVDFNINTLVIKVTGTAITEAVVKYFLKGNFESELWPSTELVENNGLYSASIRPATAECSFIVYKTVDGVESGWYKGVEAIPGQTVTMLNDQGGDATVTLNIGSTYLFAFEPETLALTVTMTSGVADIEAAEDVPAVYYNLQGVRVANPANGLFLEVRGNQVRKVAVK